MAPDLARARARLRPGWIKSWLKDPQRIVPGTRMPQNFPERPEDNVYSDILGGEQKAQIEAVTQFLLSLDHGGSQ
jgi:cbb3-type cytochrome oxidase cytochrome c subunit